jgi:hypothetical protein
MQTLEKARFDFNVTNFEYEVPFVIAENGQQE